MTTDISAPSESPTSTSSSATSSETTTIREDDEGNDQSPRTTRRGPRTNVTRTLYPIPGN